MTKQWVLWAFALATAILLFLCFPPFSINWLAPFALTPLLIASARELRWPRRLLRGYAAGVVYWFTVCNWIHFTLETHGGMGTFAAWFCFVLFALAKGLQMGAFALLAGWTLRAKLAVPATAALWVVIEYTNAPLGFAWLHLGNAGIDMTLPMRLAPMTGVWGISFLFAGIAAEIANLLLGRPGVPGFAAASILVLFLFPHAQPSPEPIYHATVVQPNIDEEQNWTSLAFNHLLARMTELSSAYKTDLLVWPEAPAPFYDNDPGFLRYLSQIARERGTYFLAGMVAHTPRNEILNSAALFAPNGDIVSRYDKINLVPFGEFVPWPLGPIAFRISNEAGDFRPGTQQTISTANGHKLATFICYESVFPNFIRKFVRNDAEVLFNPSNDGWFGKTAARFQHLEIVRMRAAENRRWILRATNDGVTAAIDPTGKVRESLPLYQGASAAMGFRYEKGLTLYTRCGDWFVTVCLAVTVLALAQPTALKQFAGKPFRSPVFHRN